MGEGRIWQFDIVPNCTAAELTRRCNDGWTDHLMQFTPDGRLNVVFSRRVVPEPVKPLPAAAAMELKEPAVEDVKPQAEKPEPEMTRSERVLAANMQRLQLDFVLRLQDGMKALQAIHPRWSALPQA